MKNLLSFSFIVLLSCTINLKAQDYFILPVDSINHLVTYSGIVEVKDRTAQQLYLKGKEWFAVAFNSGKTVIDLDDNVSYKIIGKGKISIIVKGNLGKQPGGYVNFTISLFFKDNKYKYGITNFIHEGTGSVGSAGSLEQEKQTGALSRNNFFAYKNNWYYCKEQTNEQILNLIASLKAHMEKIGKDESW